MRMTRNELRELLLASGLEMLREEGLATGAERLTFKRVFDRVEDETGIRVTNASVIRRIWRDNEDYQNDVLSLAVSDQSVDELQAALKKADQVLKKANLSTVDGRRTAVTELCRVAGGAHAEALAASRGWQLFAGTWANIASRPEDKWDERVTDAARATYAGLTERLAETMQGYMDVLGLRLRDGLTLQQFAVSVVALAEGCALRDRTDPAGSRKIKLPTGPGGRRQDWGIFSIGFEALVWRFLELAPRSRR